MPSVSKKQHNLMAAVAHNPTFAKKVGISQSVGKDFSEADKGRKFNKGGDMKKEMKAAGIFAKAGEKKLAAHERREAMGKEKDTPAIAKKEMAALKKAKAPEDVMKYERKEHAEMGFKKGGRAKLPPRPNRAMLPSSRRAMAPPSRSDIAPTLRVPPGESMGMSQMGMNTGGGIESKGKTRGAMIKMARGGGIESKGKTRGKFI